MKPKGMGGHQSANMRTDEWLTPPQILRNLGEFDLDPCSPITRPWDTAKTHYTIQDNGLVLPWFGRVWLNPPYGKALEVWMEKMAAHAQGIALIFARTDVKAWHRHIFPVADSLLFIERRIVFRSVTGVPGNFDGGAPSVLIAYGEQNVEALEHSGIRGKHVFLNTVPIIVVGVNQSWRTIVEVAFTRIGGEGALDKIYDIVERIAPTRVTQNKHYKEKIRQVLQLHFVRVGKGKYQSRKNQPEQIPLWQL